MCKGLWDGAYSLSSLSEKTRKSNHLQMLLQRQHFLLSYLKTLSVGPAGVWTYGLPLSRPVLSPMELTGRRFVESYLQQFLLRDRPKFLLLLKINRSDNNKTSLWKFHRSSEENS